MFAPRDERFAFDLAGELCESAGDIGRQGADRLDGTVNF
jgi:hypothetical protein